FVHVGGEYAGSGYASGNERSLVWREIEAAFESRIATGAVINYNHIEPRRFLEDAGDIVLERVRDAVERHGSVKVNTAFNGEFATKDKRANKSIITKNSEIYRYTDMREWDKHVNVLYLQDQRNDGVGHFAWIKDLSRLVCSQLTRKEHKKYFCDRKDVISANVPMEALSKQQWETYRTATRCHICEKPFAPDDTRVRDHCHLTGRYRGPAHTNCNLNYKNSYTIPVVFHNLSGYDGQFIIKEIATAYDGHVELFPITKEKYISFTKHVDNTKDKNKNHFQKNCIKLRFIDSFKFLSTSLEKLASYLDKNKLQIVRSEFTTLSDEEFELLTRKGVFPYEYIDCVEKLQDTRLPSRELFFSSLTGDTVSESDYAHAVNVWQRFSIRTLGEYSDLYLKTDVLLLADIFENFRNSCVASYGLDPAHYYTLPGFTWDAMLKHTRVKFELLTDIDMIMFIERGIRGGLSQCSGRYAQANNKYMRSYDPSKPSLYLMYYDVNNLYGWAMCQPLPYSEFRWVEDAANFDASAIASDSSTGYILEVDLEYTQHLHDRHSDLPFCPTRDKPPSKREDKLLATLYDKQRYVIHYRNLQQCTRHGLRVTKIHRVLQFAQSPWLRDYIELNTKFRTVAKNEFEKNLYKLMNNAVFGKSMENVHNHVDVKLVTKWDGRYGAEAMIAKPNFHSRSVFAENLIAVELRKLEVKFNKPIYVGMCILDISKVCLYEFHHEYMSPMYSDKCKIMYTDTDSLIYRIECDDAYETMKRDIARFDTSDYPADNAYGMPLANKKVPGLMKDENNSMIMTEFFGLRAKMYVVRVDGKKDTKNSKGVKSIVVARTITFDDYTRCLNEEIEMTCRQSCMRSKLHEVYTISESKIALSPYDDKRYVVPDSTETLPWGYWRIPL
ncbi:DNA polymerase, partial [Trachymyrmex cornetzi]